VEAAAAGSPPDAAGGSAAGRRPAALALAWVASERGDLAEAARRVQAVHDLPRDDVVSVAALTLVRARILRARGDLPGSLAVLDRLVSSPRALPGWLEDRLTAAAAQVWTLQGRPGDAVERVQHSADDGAACLLALGWAKLPLGAPGESGRLARQVLHRAELPVDLRVEAHLLAAAGALALGHTDPAAAEVGEATRWAAAEGLRRPLDEAPSRIRALLEQRTLRSSPAPAPRSEHPAHLPATPARDVLVQPLTEREREVLGYLDALLPTDEIAAEMFVSVNTVKTHVRAIMRKLSADRRNEAVRRARDLGLV
jgi:LuxR family maltose regulon positive regulatory protein